MINTILGSKVGTSQTYVSGFRIPVTKVNAGPCVVTHIKNMNRDGYWAIQLGFSTRRPKVTSKPLQGHLKKSTNNPITQSTNEKSSKFPRFLKEIKADKEPEQKVGDEIKASDIFNPGDIVSVTGTSKGKGFAGVVKRHGFRGGPRTHGQSDRERAPGSIGQTTTPGRVYKGKRMAGRMGSETITVKNLHVISIDPETGVMEISGQVPGTPNSLLTTKKIYSQKGTGGARHGSKRAPIFVGGGIAFGPRPVKRELNLSQVQKKEAKSSAFSLKAHDKQIVVVSGISKLGKTKEAADFLKKIAKAVEAKSFTFVISDDSKVARFLRNIKNVSVVSFAKANALDIWTGGTLIIDKDAFGEKSKPTVKESERGGTGRRGTRGVSSGKKI